MREKSQQVIRLDELEAVLKIMKENKVMAFTFKDLSVNFDPSAFYPESSEEVKTQKSAPTLEDEFDIDLTDEEKRKKIREKEDELLFGSAIPENETDGE